MRAVRSLWWREIIRFLRQPSRVVGALGQPIVFWLLAWWQQIEAGR